MMHATERREARRSHLLTSVAVISLTASGAWAGNVFDSDADLVPDVYDNCTTLANGPNDLCHQIDANLDGYGNTCDPDFNDDGTTTVGDFGIFFQCFTNPILQISPPAAVCDMNCDGVFTVGDFAPFFAAFSVAPPGAPGNAPGPSGLTCAGTPPCQP